VATQPLAGAQPAGGSTDTLNRLGFGLLVTHPEGAVIDANPTARSLVAAACGEWPEEASCCSLFGCRRNEPLSGHCISELASISEDPLPELRVDFPPERPNSAVWITAARSAGPGSPVLIHLRRAAMGDRRQRSDPHWMVGPYLRITALGRTRVQTQETAIEGQWLLQRPGQLLKYLVCCRGRPAHVDEIAEALWPRSGTAGRGSVRYFIHLLRERLEPSRERRSPSSFIVSVSGTYALDSRVELDLDEFESLALAGLRESRNGSNGGDDAIRLLEQALDLYRGHLMQEEPFAVWAFSERERLRAIALRSLQTLVAHYHAAGQPELALERLEHFADLWPLDTDVQRGLIELYLQQGRRSDSKRRYAAFRANLLDEFGEEPDFKFSDLTGIGNIGD
jgi:DNA-binding SARP family transcriptional activator